MLGIDDQSEQQTRISSTLIPGLLFTLIDDQSEQQTGDERGRYPGFFERQRGSAFRRREKGGGLPLGGRVLGGAELGRVGAYGAWFGAAVYGEDDRAEPRADHPSDHLPPPAPS